MKLMVEGPHYKIYAIRGDGTFGFGKHVRLVCYHDLVDTKHYDSNNLLCERTVLFTNDAARDKENIEKECISLIKLAEDFTVKSALSEQMFSERGV